MPVNARKKGKSGELELAGMINARLGQSILVRNLQQTRSGGYDLKVDDTFLDNQDESGRNQEPLPEVDRLDKMAIEVKRHKSCKPANIKNWWQQAVRQADAREKIPVLCYRADYEGWSCMFSLFKTLDKSETDNCITMTLNLFCKLLKEPDLLDPGL